MSRDSDVMAIVDQLEKAAGQLRELFSPAGRSPPTPSTVCVECGDEIKDHGGVEWTWCSYFCWQVAATRERDAGGGVGK